MGQICCIVGNKTSGDISIKGKDTGGDPDLSKGKGRECQTPEVAYPRWYCPYWRQDRPGGPLILMITLYEEEELKQEKRRQEKILGGPSQRDESRICLGMAS